MRYSPGPQNLNRRTVAAAFTAFILAGTSLAPAVHALTPQEKHVASVASNVMSLANSGRRGNALRNDVAALLNRYSDIRGIARFALGRYRKSLPSKLAKKYNTAVLYYVAGLFTKYADQFVGSGVDIKASHPSGKFVLVDSSVQLARGGSTALRWRLRASGNYRKISDISFKGVWLSLRLRDEFTSVLKRTGGDFDALISHLHASS